MHWGACRSQIIAHLKVAALHALLMPQVRKTGNARQGYDFNIRFDPVSTPGNLPLLRVASLDQVTGACIHVRAAVEMMLLTLFLCTTARVHSVLG